MRLLAGGVCIAATVHQGSRFGLTVTAVCSLTLEPPTLVVCVNRSANAYAAMVQARRISINFLSSGHLDVAKTFSSAAVRGEDRFHGAEWVNTACGLPALRDALACLGCDIIEEKNVGQHAVLFCQVRSVHLGPGQAPLVHFDREFCELLPLRARA